LPRGAVALSIQSLSVFAIVGLIYVSCAEVKNGMGWVIVGALSSSLVLTLFLVPTMYYILDTIKDWVTRLFSKKQKITA